MTIGRQRTARSGWDRSLQARIEDREIQWRKVQAARRRLDAGYYDREDVLENVLDAILADLTESEDVHAMQATDTGERR
jgi:hypothetical protein